MPGSPQGPQGYTDLVHAMTEQWREHLALLFCYIVIGAYWLQHHYSGRIYARSDHWFGAINLLFLLAIVIVPYPIRIWVFHLGTVFEPVASVVFTTGVASIACAWMSKWFYGVVGRRTMDERLAADFIQQMTRRYGLAAITQIAAVPISAFAPHVGVAVTLLSVAFFFLPQPRPRYHPSEEPSAREMSDG